MRDSTAPARLVRPRIGSMKTKTFRQLYCEQRGIVPARYESTLLRATLRWPGRVLHRVRGILPAALFAADHDFVVGVGFLTGPKDFDVEATEFLFHPQNRGFLRRQLRVRVSIFRLRRVVSRVFARAEAEAEAAAKRGPRPAGGSPYSPAA